MTPATIPPPQSNNDVYVPHKCGLEASYFQIQVLLLLSPTELDSEIDSTPQLNNRNRINMFKPLNHILNIMPLYST